MNDRSATTTSAGAPTSPASRCADVGPLAHLDPRVAPEPLVRAGRSRRRRRPPRAAPRWRQAVGEAAGRRAGVEDDRGRPRRPPKRVERGVELLAAPRHEPRPAARRPRPARRAPTSRAGLSAGAPPTVTRPAAITARACSRLGDQPPPDQLGVEAAPRACRQPAAFLAGAFRAAVFFVDARARRRLRGRGLLRRAPCWPESSSPPAWPRGRPCGPGSAGPVPAGRRPPAAAPAPAGGALRPAPRPCRRRPW